MVKQLGTAEELEEIVSIERLRSPRLLTLHLRFIDLIKVFFTCNEYGESHGIISWVHYLQVSCLSSPNLDHVKIDGLNNQVIAGLII